MSHYRLEGLFKRTSLVMNAVAFLIGTIVTLGWVFDVQTLKSILPHFISMKFNTALCFFVLAAGNFIFLYGHKVKHLVPLICSLMVLVVCFLTLLEYQFDWNFGIDEFFYVDPVPLGVKGRYPPGRMAPITATLFILVSLSQIFLCHVQKFARSAQFLLVMTLIVAFQAFVNYFFGITYSYGLGYHTQMAFHTTVGFICLALGTLFKRPDLGWMEIIVAESAGGKMARNLITWAMLVPPFIQWLNIMGEQAGLYDENFSGVLRVTGNIIFFTTLVLKNAGALHRSTLEQMKIQEEKLLMQAEAKAAQSIKDNEEKFRGIFEASFDAIIVMDSAGSTIDCNHRAERMFGWSKAQIIGKSLRELIKTDEDPALNKTIEVDGLRANRESFPIQLSVTSINLGGKPLLMGFISDITERKRNEKELIEARQDALNAAQAKAAFLANMSHEIRTPLNGIIGMTDLLLETNLNDVQKKYAKIVQSSGTGLLSIINDILDFSKIDAGKMNLEVIEFNPKTLVEEQAELMAARAAAKDLPLLSYIQSDVPECVKGDPGRIGQILLNLISNAIKFTKEGRITVKVSARYDSLKRCFLLFQVLDTGIGLSSEQCENLFRPFTQADESTARKYGGTGLGLSISRQLTELMKGKIWVESSFGHGSTFCFEIPLEVVSTKVKKRDELKGLRAFIIDDDPVAREIICHYLKADGMETFDFANSQDFLDRSASCPVPDVFIIDKSMPVLSGIDLAMKLSHDDHYKNVPRILITAYEKISENGFFMAVLGKPIKQSDLYESVLSVTQGTPVALPTRMDLDKIEGPAEHRVLVAEDNSVNQLLTSIQLKKLGYSVHVVANGLEVLEALSKGHFDLILMDCHMPEMDGYEATRQIRELEKRTQKHITIVALTANAMKEDEDLCRSVGMDDFISKPTKKEVLAKVLSKWLVGPK